MLALYTEIDQKNGIADTLNNIGGELALEGDLSVPAIYEKTLAMRRAIGDRGGVGVTWNNMGDMLLGLGQISAAKAAYAGEAIEAFQETGQKASSAYPLFGLGQALAAVANPPKP